jgi:hypothetical protein
MPTSLENLCSMQAELSDLLQSAEALVADFEQLADPRGNARQNFPTDESDEAGTAAHFAETSHVPRDLFEKVDAGFRKRNDGYLRKVFERHWEDEAAVISRGKLKNALEEVDIFFAKEEEVDTFLETMDISGDGVLDFEEFKRAVRFPGPIEQWAKTMDLAQLLTDSIPVKEGIDALRALSQMSNTDIDDTCAAFIRGLKRMLAENVLNLRNSFETQDTRDAQADQHASKFEIFSLSCGRINDFHKGISGRIGEDLKCDVALFHDT